MTARPSRERSVWMVLGLGNPGSEYAGTRHNVGFAVVQRLGDRHGIRLTRVRHRARFGTGSIGGDSVLLAMPETYMNLAGEAARPLMSYHGIDADTLIVVHDEADLEPGTIRVKSGGGTAGHNGLRSLVTHLGTREFTRVRIGIGRPERSGTDMADHVLSRPVSEAAKAISEGVELAVEAVETVINEGVEAAMRTFNRRDRTE